MKIVFRVDGNLCVGAGHVMRCLSLALAASKQNINCIFYIADKSFKSRIEENGFDVVILDTKYDELDNEIPIIEFYLQRDQPDYIVADSYYVTDKYLSSLKKYGRLVYIDDVASFAYPVDILVNYNIYASVIDYDEIYSRENSKTPLRIIGPSYAPLREEFQGMSCDLSSNQVTDILVSVGGADPERMALGIIKCLLTHEAEIEKYKFHFIVGSFEPDADKIESIASDKEWLVLHKNVKNMSGLMNECDVAISAAGSTLYELCACGVPTITYILADNQTMGAMAFEQAGIMINAGDVREKKDFWNGIFDLLIKICDNDALRISIARKAKNLIDGEGAARLIDQLVSAK